MSNFTVFNLKLDRETLKRLTDQTKNSKARIVKDENNLVTLDLADQRIKIEQSKRGSEMAVFYQRDTPTSNQLQLVGIPACNTFARASKKTTTAAATPTIDKVKSHSSSKESPSSTAKPKKKSSSSKSNNSNNNNSSSSPYVRPPPSPVKLDSTADFPLEERLIHLLALCPHSVNTLSKKLNSSALDVSQKIKKVAIPLKDVGTSSTKYILKPRFYSQIRIWDWPSYSSTERREVASNVEEGYNLLRLPPDAPERQNLSQSNSNNNNNTKKSSLIQPPPGKVNTQTERDRKIAAKKKLNDASPLYNNNHTPNSSISQSRAIPPSNTTPTTTTTPTSIQATPTTGSNNNNSNNHSNGNSSSTTGTPKLSVSTTGTKGKGKIGHASLSPVTPSAPNHHHTTTSTTTSNNNNSHNNNNNSNSTSTTNNKSQTLKPPTLNTTTTSSSTGTTPIARTSTNSPSNNTAHHTSAPSSTTSANTPIHRAHGKSPNIFYKPKVSSSSSTHESSTSKKRKSNGGDGSSTVKKKQKLSYKRTNIHNQAEFDHLCKEYNQQHFNYLRDLQQFRSENPVYLKVLESVPPQKSNREYAQRLKQSYDRDDFAKMLQKTQHFFTTKNYVDGMWDNVLEFADLYKINPL